MNAQLSLIIAAVDVAKWWAPQRRKRVKKDSNLMATHGDDAQGM